MAEHPNCQTVERFVEQFKTPVRIGRTERIDNERVQDGYTASFMNNVIGIGFTAVCWTANDRAHFKVLVECVGTDKDAERFGKLMGGVIE